MVVDAKSFSPFQPATPGMMDDTTPAFSFPAVAREKVTAAFDGGKITSDGGVMLLSLAERRLRLAERLAGCIPDRRDGMALRQPLLRARAGGKSDQAAQGAAALRSNFMSIGARQSGAPHAAHGRLFSRFRARSSIAVLNVIATNGPTPGALISRRQISSSRTIANMALCRTIMARRGSNGRS